MQSHAQSRQTGNVRSDAANGWARAAIGAVGNTGVAGVVAITAILYAIAIVGRLASCHWDPTGFILPGKARYYPQQSPIQLLVRGPGGYDGQFYYRLAIDPLTSQQVAYGLSIDGPAYRAQRILYPVLVHVLALGKVAWIPASMIAVNYLAICGLAFAAGRFAELFGLPALYAVAIPFLPAVVLGLARDLSEPLATSLELCALLFLCSRRKKLAGCALALLVLTRESTMLLASVIFLWSLWHALRKQSSWSDGIGLAIPLATYAAWQCRIRMAWGEWGFQTGHHNFLNVPFAALGPFVLKVFRVWIGTSTFQVLNHLLQAGELLLLLGIIFIAALVYKRSSIDPEVKVAWLAYLVLVTFYSKLIWSEDWAFMRGCAELMVLSLVVLLGSRSRRLLRLTSISTIAIWLCLAYRTMRSA
jgi:hypothetical protein